MQLQAYLDFNGRCDEAVEFYRKALGAEVTSLHRYKDCPDQSMIAPGIADKVMHVSLRIGDNMLMASDGHCNDEHSFQGFSLTFSVSTAAEAEKLFTALADGGQVEMPLTKTFFSSAFGMLADRFGVRWMIHAGA